MPGLTCNACNMEFIDEAERKLHYKSDWHRYNLKRKVAGLPGVTEELFEARQFAIAQEKGKSDEAPMLYTCGICGKGYRSSNAHEQHLQSRSHVLKVSQGTSSNGEEDKAIIRPLPRRVKFGESEDSDDEWVEVDSDDELGTAEEAVGSLSKLNVNESGSAEDEDDMDEDDAEKYELDPTCCLMCDKKHKTLESCMVHMHKHHGFFVPDIEYLKDPEGLLTYLGLKVRTRIQCSNYVDEAGDQIVAVSGEADNTVELVGGSELVITDRSENTTTTRTLGSREYMRYYRQKPRPTSQNSNQIVASLSSRYKSMGLRTVPSKEDTVKMKVMKEMNKRGQTMRTKIAMKSNVIRNLPNNVPY